MKTINTITVLRNLFCSAFTIAVIICCAGILANAQTPTYTQETFATNIPYNVANPNLRVTTSDWSFDKPMGTAGVPNNFQWVNAGSNPVAANQNIAGFAAGAGFVRYINRTVAYPAASGAAVNDAAFLITRAFDFSGHTVYNAAADTFAVSIWRDNTAGALAGLLDYVEVYINTSPTITGATLLTEKNSGAASIHRSSTQTPVAALPGAWNRYYYSIPNLTDYVSLNGGSSNVYFIIKGGSAGGNNIYLDNFNFPQWATAMQIVSSTLFYQESAAVGKNTTDNLLLGVKVTTKGSTNPYKLDAVSFSSAGSTNFVIDVSNTKTYFTAASPNFATTGGTVALPNLGSAGPATGLFNFGYWSAGCVSSAPATVSLNPGSENYVWFAVDVSAAAVSGNYIGANFQCATFVKPSGVCTYWGGPGGTVSSNSITAITPQTLGNVRQVGQSYTIPTYSVGCSANGYNNNDFISAVYLPGDNGTQINNYDHDGNPATYCSSCLSSSAQPAHCIRVGCHPSDYANFAPVNVSFYRNRFVQVTVGRGKRSGGAGYILKAQAGENPFNNNNIAIFIDWNNDGDFDDNYNGAGGVISENYGTHTMLNGDLNSYPVAAWPANTTWTIDVPDKSDVVTDLNDPYQLPNNSTFPVFLGSVRVRVREVYATSPIHPFLSSYTWGEVEDYTLQVLDNCPIPSSNVCKWIGNTNDWNDATNWCPTKPTINDMAYIPLLTPSFVYPVIKDNTTATCRILKLMDNGSGIGAQLNFNAQANGKLIVADDIIIGQGAPASGSNANINVISSFQNTLTIPAKSSAPPQGLALTPQTPFRTNAQSKTQIAYTATELASTYGWKKDDIIDQISIEVNSISGGAGPSTFQNFKIQAFLTTTQVTYQFPPPPSTKIAVAAGDANVVAGWPKTIYTGSPLILNMPMATSGTKAGGNYYTFNLAPNAMQWDGTSNLVLSFENNTSVGLAPAKSYVLYDEANGSFNVLSVNCSTVGSIITGNNIDGAGHYSGGPNATVTAAVSNNRPRLDFTWHSIYDKVTIINGGDWINNNNGVFAPSTVAGSDGFRAGYSLVSFDPIAALRSTVNSPGLVNVNTWNPVTQAASLGGALADINQDITSDNTARTVFNQLEINKVSTSNKSVRQKSATANLLGACADSLALTAGELNLNRKEFTLQNPNSNYLVKTNGWIKSEDNNGAQAGNIQSKFTWKIGTGTAGSFTIPFKAPATSIFNFVYTKLLTSDDVGDLTVATYGTQSNNQPYPTAPQQVLSMTTNPPTLDATPWTVDRSWFVDRNTNGALTGTMKFEYDNSAEGTITSAYVASEMKAQRYQLVGGNPAWQAPFAGQSDGFGGGVIRYVTLPATYINKTANTWAIVHTNALQAPLGSAGCTATTPTITPAGAVNCVGSVQLNSSAASYYSWSNGANTQNITANISGTYIVTVTDASGCTASSAGVTVTIKPGAVITPQGPTTFCAGSNVILSANAGAGFTYKWKKNGAYIGGATSINYAAALAGNYKVEVTDANSCSKTSAATTVSVPCKLGEGVPIATVSAFDVNVYPNPSSDDFIFEFANPNNSKVTITIYDVTGRLIQSVVINENQYVFHASQLNEGIYIAEITKDGLMQKLRLVKV